MEILKINEFTQLVFGSLDTEFGAFKSSGNSSLIGAKSISISHAGVAARLMKCLLVHKVVLGYGKG